MNSPEFEEVENVGSQLEEFTFLNEFSKYSAKTDSPHGLPSQLSSPGRIGRNCNEYIASRNICRQAVFKNGSCNVIQYRTSTHRLRYLQDIFTTLVDSHWGWTVFIFSLVFFGAWLVFALLWWLIALTHGDLEEEHLPKNQQKNNWVPCITGFESFTSAFLFSAETHHTTGINVRFITRECPEAIFLMGVQSFLGLILQTFMVGTVFVKLSHPRLRTQTLQFSKNAVISQRNRHLNLMFRVGDVRKSHIVGARITARLIHSTRTEEGDIIKNFQTDLSVRVDNCDGDLFLIWPVTVSHTIDATSPLYHLSASDLMKESFEIVVILEGTIESTGQVIQAESSYLSSEILWGEKFAQMIHYDKMKQVYKIDHSKFDDTILTRTPACSAAELPGIHYENVPVITPRTQSKSSS